MRLLCRLACSLLLLMPAMAEKPPVDIAREVIAPLIDPVKVATLKGDRPANARLYKALYWLETARVGGADIGETIDKAQAHLGIEKTASGAEDKKALQWAHGRLTQYGCFTVDGMDKLRRGGSPQITLGPSAGQPPFPALRSKPMALSGTSHRKQILSSKMTQ